MTLVLYGSPRSRTLRTLWMLAELGLEFEHVPLEFADPALKTAEFLALNPAGAIPTLVDHGFAISESLAINLYLARRYGQATLYPHDVEGEAMTWRWTLWAQGHLEPWIMYDSPLADGRPAIAPLEAAAARRSLAVLDGVLSARPWLAAEEFSVADLNVAAVLSPSRSQHLDLAPFPHVKAWLALCYGRPAALETRRRFQP